MKIALINEKGGTGKTTLAVHLSAWLAGQGDSVLLVDMDPQGQVGKALGFPSRTDGKNVADLFGKSDVSPQDLVEPTDIENLDVIRSDKRLAAAADKIAGRKDGHLILSEKFRNYRGHKHVVFDSPPSLGILTRNILWAVQKVVLPVASTYLALDGCAELIQTVDQVQDARGSKQPEVAAIVPTFRRPTRLAAEVIDRLHAYFPEWVTESIGFYVAVDEAQSFGKTVWDYRTSSTASRVFQDICADVAAKLGTR